MRQFSQENILNKVNKKVERKKDTNNITPHIIDGYKVYNQYSAKTFGIVKNNEYVAAKNITVYSDKNCNKVKFKINKGSKIYITELYKNGNKKLIKVKSTEGKTGYVKIGTKLLFTKKSCVWAR